MPRETLRTLIEKFGLGGMTLQELLLDEASRDRGLSAGNTAPTDHGMIVMAKAIYEARRARCRHFGGLDLFGEAAWDILLDVFIRQGEGEKVSVKSACVGSGVPASTALRWLNVLEFHGLLMSEDDPDDQRRRLLSLTPHGLRTMTDCLAEFAGPRPEIRSTTINSNGLLP